LTEKVDLFSEENIGTLQLAKVKPLGRKLIRGRHHWVDISLDVVTELCASFDDRFECFLFLRLKGQVRDFILPGKKIFQLGSSCITGNLDPIITDRARVVVVFLDLTAR
jgi:hypothetical protein